MADDPKHDDDHAAAIAGPDPDPTTEAHREASETAEHDAARAELEANQGGEPEPVGEPDPS